MADPAQLEQLVATDPDLQAVFAKLKTAPAYQVPQLTAELDALFKTKGIAAALPKGYGWGADGKIHQQSWLLRNGDKLGIALVAGGIGGSALIGLGAVGGSTPALGPVAAGGGTTAATVPPALAAAGGAGTAGTAAGTAAAAGGGGSLLHSLLPSIIGAGASLAGTGIAAHANTEAAKLAAAQADKALQIQKEQYALQRQDTAPYRALAQGALGNLGYGMGIDYQKDIPALSSTMPTTPYGQSASSLSALGQSSANSGLVPMRTPDGKVLGIPQTHVAEAQQHGAQLVNP